VKLSSEATEKLAS